MIASHDFHFAQRIEQTGYHKIRYSFVKAAGQSARLGDSLEVNNSVTHCN